MSPRLKIVVADDEPETRDYFREYLSYLGHEVRAAGDGRQLVEVCREFGPDVVVTDFAMPGLDGLAAAAAIKRDGPVPVILVTGRQDVELPPGGGPVIACLSKPVKEAALKAAVESAAAGSGKG